MRRSAKAARFRLTLMGLPALPTNVRYRGQTGKHILVLAASFTAHDPYGTSAGDAIMAPIMKGLLSSAVEPSDVVIMRGSRC